MDKFDEKVIGYESTKEILRQILDILKRPEVYKRKGISIPRGLLMESDPGLGKSLLASILMEESERKPFESLPGFPEKWWEIPDPERFL